MEYVAQIRRHQLYTVHQNYSACEEISGYLSKNFQVSPLTKAPALQQIRREKEREALRAKAKDFAIEKKLPAHLVDFFISDSEEKTLENLGLLEQVWTQSIQAAVGETFKQHGREPHKPANQQQMDNPWRKETFNLTKQAQILKENPELAQQLMTQAKE